MNYEWQLLSELVGKVTMAVGFSLGLLVAFYYQDLRFLLLGPLSFLISLLVSRTLFIDRPPYQNTQYSTKIPIIGSRSKVGIKLFKICKRFFYNLDWHLGLEQEFRKLVEARCIHL